MSTNKRAIPGLNLYDVVVKSKDWRNFKKTATQDEVQTLAIGSKYRLKGVQYFVKAIISVIGMIASVTIGLSTVATWGWFSVALLVGGYVFFNFLASKLCSYQDTYGKCLRLLNSDGKEKIKQLFGKENALVALLRWFVVLALTFITIPFQAILLLIGTLMPAAENWIISHGVGEGVVLSIPKGQDIGNLGALGEYYRSCSFMDAWDRQRQMDKQEEQINKARVVYEDGYKRTLNYVGTGYYNGEAVNRYRDEQGRLWLSDGSHSWLDNEQEN